MWIECIIILLLLFRPYYFLIKEVIAYVVGLHDSLWLIDDLDLKPKIKPGRTNNFFFSSMTSYTGRGS